MKNVAKKISLVAILLAGMSVHAVAQTTTPPAATQTPPPAATQDNAPKATQTVCQSSSTDYTINPILADSYAWKVEDGAKGTDYKYTESTNNQFTVEWVNEGEFKLMSQATNDGCKGPWSVVTVTVAPKPTMPNQTATLCSYVTTEQEDKLKLELPTTFPGAKGDVKIDKWLIEVNVPTGVTRYGVDIDPNTGSEFTDPKAIAGDYFVNSNPNDAVVKYTITPYAGDCVGDPATYTVTVKPAVAAPTITW